MTEKMKSCLYSGAVIHRRLGNHSHYLKYRVFSFLIDLDELSQLDKQLSLFAWNRWNAISFWEKDYGDGSGQPLKDYALSLCDKAGCKADLQRVEILCYPRLWGYTFNPLSIYFCYDRDDRLSSIIYEVTNTYGERHSYILPQNADQFPQHRCAKKLYVSPFLPMEAEYQFRIVKPDDKVSVAIRQKSSNGDGLNAVFAGKRQSITDSALAWNIIKNPAMTQKVMVGIHWEAIKLWKKSLPIFRHTPTQTNSHTIIEASRTRRKTS